MVIKTNKLDGGLSRTRGFAGDGRICHFLHRVGTHFSASLINLSTCVPVISCYLGTTLVVSYLHSHTRVATHVMRHVKVKELSMTQDSHAYGHTFV